MDIVFLLITVVLGCLGFIPAKVYFDSSINEVMGIFLSLSILTHQMRIKREKCLVLSSTLGALLFASFFLHFSLSWLVVVLSCFYMILFLVNVKEVIDHLPWHVAIWIFTGLTLVNFFFKI